MKYKYTISNYTEDEFNKKGEEYEQLVDGVHYPPSLLWRDVATTALELANYADWFDRYDQKNNSRKD